MTVLLNILFEWAGATKTHEMHKKQERRCDSPTSETSSINFEPFFLLKIWIWWYPSLTPKNKQTDAWQMSWYLSKYYLLVLFFPLSMQLLTIHHCLWSQLSKCLLNVTQVFKQDVCVCCGDKKATRMWGNGMCVGIWMCEMHTDMCREHYCNLCVCANGCVCVCVCVYTSGHKPYPERDKSNPLPGWAQGSSIDGTLSGCWWTSLSDKVYHSDLSQSKTLSGISKHQANLRPTFSLKGNWADTPLESPQNLHNTFAYKWLERLQAELCTSIMSHSKSSQ